MLSQTLGVFLLGMFVIACGDNNEPMPPVLPPEGVVQHEQDTTSTTPESRGQKPPVLARPQFDIRGLRWGMSKEEVKAREPRPVKYEYSSHFAIDDEIANEKVSVTFRFESGKLVRVFYQFDHEGDVSIFLYEWVSKVLNEKYGKPDASSYIARYGDEDKHVFELWRTDRTTIHHWVWRLSHNLMYEFNQGDLYERLKSASTAGKL